jgi:hypothetical protein
MYSLSKAYGFRGMAGRLHGVSAHLEAAMAKIQDTVLICAPVASQVAAAAALDVGRAYASPSCAAGGSAATSSSRSFDARAARAPSETAGASNCFPEGGHPDERHGAQPSASSASTASP